MQFHQNQKGMSLEAKFPDITGGFLAFTVLFNTFVAVILYCLISLKLPTPFLGLAIERKQSSSRLRDLNKCLYKRIMLTGLILPSDGGGRGGGTPRGGGMGRGRGRGRGGRDMSLISQTVRICQGPYKGELAISRVQTSNSHNSTQ